MASADYQNAIREGVMAATRLHKSLGLKELVSSKGGSINVFDAIQKLEIPLLIRPLNGLLGAYINTPEPGILITTKRPMSIQRFTAAHELGHFKMEHQPSLDDESILRRMSEPIPLPNNPLAQYQEIEADAFAAEFIMPRWLLIQHATRQGWTKLNFTTPSIVYQLSLRIGASYEATCWTLVRHTLISQTQARKLLDVSPRSLKTQLLENYTPENYRGDVWLLTERDEGTRIDGSRNDLFVIRLNEHSNGGYIWDIHQLTKSGFVIVGDKISEIDPEGIGAPVVRNVTTAPPETYRGPITLVECRPWDAANCLTTFDVECDLTGPEEEGLSRAERRTLLEAA
jgi:Zn-dependent peptidase ImmA (M78 family)